MSQDFSDDSVKITLLECYVNFDDFFWNQYSKECRTDIRDLYKHIMNLNHQGYSKIVKNELYAASLLINGSMDCFELLQKRLNQKV